MRPTVNEVDILKNSNDILLQETERKHTDEQPPNVLMAHAGEDSIFNKTEVLAGQWDGSDWFYWLRVWIFQR